MPSARLKHIGFIDPRQWRGRRRAVVVAQLITAITLMLSITVSAVAVGIARACAPVTPVAGSTQFH